MFKFTAIDLFCGCGGMTEGLKQAGFDVVAGIELDKYAAETYKLNHGNITKVFQQNIADVDMNEILKLLHGRELSLLAACPPCQGFSSLRRKNKQDPVKDPRNKLIYEFFRFVVGLQPVTFILENVPALQNYIDFKNVYRELENLGYLMTVKIVDVAKFSVPQRRKRLIMIGSLFNVIALPEGSKQILTVRDAIGDLETTDKTTDFLHKIYPRHTAKIQAMIHLIPRDGGSREDLSDEYTLECHKKDGIGFHDIYGRLKWNKVSSTITGGCLNPSKGRFLHPDEDRCISAREASLLQTFPKDYKFPININKGKLALMIGNAVPPKFSYEIALGVRTHLYNIYKVFDQGNRNHVRNMENMFMIIVKEILCSLGYRNYRFSTSQLNSSPNIVFPVRKKAIFINWCFLNGHKECQYANPIINNEKYEKIILNNKKRNQMKYDELNNKHWKYLILWQCEVKKDNDELKLKLKNFMEM
jgi:DNA (cytosine-5)-methyltransferase 1